MELLCDLHTHSHFSDGTLSPTQLIRMAENLGLGAVALCDHNTVAGLPEFVEAARGSTVEAVPSIEISTEYKGWELHILALFVQPAYYDTITAMMDAALERKQRSNEALIRALNRAGYELDLEKIKAQTPRGHINRAHIARELTSLGYTASIQEAFSELLDPSKGIYQPPRRLDACEVIRFIRSIHAVPVMAHPFLSLPKDNLPAFLEIAVTCGLAGIETMYSAYSEETTRLAQQIAGQFGLKQSGGSDFHGSNKPDIRMGFGKGNLAVPMHILDELRNS